MHGIEAPGRGPGPPHGSDLCLKSLEIFYVVFQGNSISAGGTRCLAAEDQGELITPLVFCDYI